MQTCWSWRMYSTSTFAYEFSDVMKALEKSILDYDNQIENLKKLGEFHAQKNVIPEIFMTDFFVKKLQKQCFIQPQKRPF